MGWRQWVAVVLLGVAPGAWGDSPAAAEEFPPWFKNSMLDLRDDLTEARQGGKRLLIYFYQEGCPYCARLLADNFGQRAIADKTRASFDLVAINIWGDMEVTDLRGGAMTEKRFAESLRVMFTPTLLFLDGEGRQVVRLDGYYPPHKFDKALDYAAGRAGAGMSFSEYMQRSAPQPASGSLQPEPFFVPPPHDLARFGVGSGPMLAVLFEQKECAACDEFHREVLAREETRKRLGAFAVVQIDRRALTPVVTPSGEKTTAREWAGKLGLQYAPSMVFFDPHGREVFRLDAWLRPFHVQTALDYVASGAYREQPSFQRFIRARADAMRARGEKVDIME